MTDLDAFRSWQGGPLVTTANRTALAEWLVHCALGLDPGAYRREGADLALLNNAGNSALQWAERRVRLDRVEPEEGEEAPTTAQVAEHKALVVVLKARGA